MIIHVQRPLKLLTIEKLSIVTNSPQVTVKKISPVSDEVENNHHNILSTKSQ